MSEKPLRDRFIDLHLHLRPRGFCHSLKMAEEATFEVVVLGDDTYLYGVDFGGLEGWHLAYSLQDLLHALSVEASEFNVENWRGDRS